MDEEIGSAVFRRIIQQIGFDGFVGIFELTGLLLSVKLMTTFPVIRMLICSELISILVS